AQWRGNSINATVQAIPVNTPTNTLNTNNWYKFTAKFVNTSATNANQSTVEASVQDMGVDGVTAGGIMLASPIMATNIVDLVTSNRWYFGVRNIENGGIDYLDNIFVTTQPGPLALVTNLDNPTVAQ